MKTMNVTIDHLTKEGVGVTRLEKKPMYIMYAIDGEELKVNIEYVGKPYYEIGIRELNGAITQGDIQTYLEKEVLKEAQQLSNHPLVMKALNRLQRLYEVLCAYGVEKYVSFDLGMLSSYQYYTGIIFKVYTLGIGDVIVKGGRYDKLLPYFGKNSPAIGFVIVIDDLMQALKRQKIEIDTLEQNMLLVYDGMNFADCLKEAKLHRSKGIHVQIMKYDNTKRLQAIHFFQNLYFRSFDLLLYDFYQVHRKLPLVFR